MKRLQTCLAGIAVVAMLFTSCSKEEEISISEPDPNMATLSFGPILNDLNTNRSVTKQANQEFPECSNDDPAYVGIVLSIGGNNVVGEEGEPFRVDLTANQLFTEEVSELELEPGVYSLDYFGVYNDDDELIWLAPAGGLMSEYLESPLPLSIDLGAGVKKYVEVSVLCFDDRLVNEYGYLFFELDGVQAIEFCVFGNYCDESGRHYPAEFSISVWDYEDGQQGSPIYSSLSNEVTQDENGDYSGSSLCIALPDTNGEDEYYFEITILNSDAYGSVQEQVIRSGVITDEDVRDLFDGDLNVNYYHFREGDCNLSDSPNLFTEGGGNGECDPNDPNADCDNDGVINSVDQCLSTDPGVEVNEVGCESIQVPGRDIVVFNDVNLFDGPAMENMNNVRLVQNLVNFTTSGSRNSGDTFMFNYQNGLGGSSTFVPLWSEMRDIITAEGFTISDTPSQSDLLNIPSNVKIIMLVLPLAQYTVEAINSLKTFAAEGGRIIFMGEHEEIYGAGIPIENDFLISMGAVLRNTGGYVDCLEQQGQPHIEITSESLRDHPIMEGINNLSVACASVIEPGPDDFALFYDTTNTYVLGGVAKIDVTPVSSAQASSVTKNSQPNKSNVLVSDFLGNR